ncbi:hypothetical protein WHT83_24040 [Aminobacter sp. P9b]|uniref:hypothetical protein n=1 Tax=Aminobacter sp. P9b TaxID=3133697 RepID=UPI0032467206
MPTPEADELPIDIRGDLAGILAISLKAKNPPRARVVRKLGWFWSQDFVFFARLCRRLRACGVLLRFRSARHRQLNSKTPASFLTRAFCYLVAGTRNYRFRHLLQIAV